MNSIRCFRIAVCCGCVALAGGCQTAAKQVSILKPAAPVVVNEAPEEEVTADKPIALVDMEAAGEEVELTAYLDGPMTAEAAPTIPPAPPASKLDPVPETAAGDGFTLEALEYLALQNNPAIAQAAASAHKATGFRQQVGRYPNPIVGYSGQQLDDKGTDQHMAYVQQDFISAHKLRLNERVLDHEVQSQLWEVEAQRYRVLTDIRIRFYQALAAQQRGELAKEFQQVAGEGVRIAEIRRQALEGSVPEVLQAEIQLNEVDLIRQRAEITYLATWSELIAVAGMPGMAEQRLIGNLRVDAPPRDWNAAFYEIAQNNPSLLAARSRIGRAAANMTRQEVQAVPNMQAWVGGGYDNGTNNQMMNVQMGLPLPIFNKNGGNISAAQAEFCRAAQDVRRIELSIKQRLAMVSRQYDSASITVDRLEKQILPRAKQTLELSEKAYGAGEFGFLQVLVARRTFFDSNLQYNTALVELAEAKSMVDGLLLDGGLNDVQDTQMDDGLRGQALSGQ
ncbi:TolC family protein [Planctomicrobium piriforme]|uniref:Outer membrane protein, cobalt-zinc-cadmium efflux system n=1 Tax=Planctomicrobium piriforme TaxID=1576369 RepID=A0A1I3BBE4_9PLAN|nr:TolC family protein [Planctomicrobium piriforme]SFH59396.1 outer membrane protein, cobalt-zinc-cadmium efflux system [Planctomicrobium piriforme]